MHAPLVVGFDLDMTLIDTVPGFAATLDALGAELGIDFPTAELTSNLGPPLDHMLADFLPADRLGPAGDRFRALYPNHAIAPVGPLPGARESLAAVRRQHGRVLVVTGKHTPNAQLHVDHLGLDVDTVVGWVWGHGKGAVLREHGAVLYVGDHVHDVEGALAAGITSVSVLTGGCTEAELRAAGTEVVLASLAEFPAWFDGWLQRRRTAELLARLGKLDSLLVAYSGGADSALLLAAAVRALGPDKVAAATAYSDSLPQAEREPARAFAESLGVRTFTPRTHEIDRDGYRANAGDRCFFCKAELLDTLAPLAAEHGFAAVATGTNADDLRAGFRPGVRAAAERGALTPLADAGFTKEQVRALSREWGLPTWDKPAAACLSSRVAYGIEITPARLARVERAEAAVRTLLPHVRDVRVRDLGDSAWIEVDAELVDQVDDAVLAAVRAAGFERAEADPRGFRSGAMNELLADPDRYR